MVIPFNQLDNLWYDRVLRAVTQFKPRAEVKSVFQQNALYVPDMCSAVVSLRLSPQERDYILSRFPFVKVFPLGSENASKSWYLVTIRNKE